MRGRTDGSSKAGCIREGSPTAFVNVEGTPSLGSLNKCLDALRFSRLRDYTIRSAQNAREEGTG